MHYVWDFDVVLAFTDFWLKGASITLAYAFGTITGGLIIGVFAGMALLFESRKFPWLGAIVSAPIYAYVQVFRCTPLLVQIVWFYYALPVLWGASMPAWMASGLGLMLYMGAFSSEIFRAGIMSIDKGQWQASRALGMTYSQMMRRIILPQATRRMVPPFVNQSILQLKNTSLLYVVAVPDIMYTGSIIVAETFRPLEVYTSVAIMYFCMLFPLQRFAARMEARRDI
jgi:polar amino acid transport system permease protein